MISAVVFDWGGVLIEEPSLKMFSYCASFLGVPVVKLRKSYTEYEDAFEKGMINEDVLWARMCSSLGVPPPTIPSLFSEAFRKSYIEKKEMFEFASTLQQQGYRTGLLSNTEYSSIKRFHEIGYSMFDVTVFSCEEKVRKPDPHIYQILLKRLKKPANEVVFIDDRPVNIEGAKTVGLHTILYTTKYRFTHDLSALSSQLGTLFSQLEGNTTFKRRKSLHPS